MIKCSKCGFDNSSGHLYCVKCNTKLNLDQITREYFSKAQSRNHSRWQIWVIPALFIMVSLAMALCPDQIDPIKASDPEGVQARRKINILQQGVATEPIEFSEKEVNILFNSILQESRHQTGKAGGISSIYAGRVKIKPGSMTIHLSNQIGPCHFGSFTMGPYWLTYKANGIPKRTPEGLRFAAHSGSIGYFPFLGRYLTMAHMKRIFRSFKNARSFLNDLEIVEMKQGSITVSVKR